jgi:hypothetical protein
MGKFTQIGVFYPVGAAPSGLICRLIDYGQQYPRLFSAELVANRIYAPIFI